MEGVMDFSSDSRLIARTYYFSKVGVDTGSQF